MSEAFLCSLAETLAQEACKAGLPTGEVGKLLFITITIPKPAPLYLQQDEPIQYISFLFLYFYLYLLSKENKNIKNKVSMTL